jgi:hypothetical protein
MSSRPELRLDWCSHEAAKYAVEHWHYSGCVPNQKTVKVGVWEDERFIGCVLFGNGANNNMGKPYRLRDIEVCELVRVALGAHKTPVSRIVRIALSFLRSRCPGIRLVVSYADPEQGHHGGIYQAGNWLYAGTTTAADEYLVNGARMHGRALRSTRSTHKFGHLRSANVLDWAKIVLDPNARRISGSVKHRYLYPLDPEMRAKIAPLAKPYPKRPRSVDSDAPATHAGEEGATPILGLHDAAPTAHAEAAD